MNHAPYRISLLLLIVVLTLVAHAQHQHATPSAAFTFTGDGFEGPAELPSGYHTFTLQNDAEAPIDIMILKPTGGASTNDALVAYRALGDAFSGAGGDPLAAINVLLDTAELHGGPLAPGGATGSAGVMLESGTYVLVGQPHAPDATYYARELAVTEATAAAEPPPVDLTVNMVDFAFTIPDRLEAGTQTWELINRGEQVHHLILVRLHPDRSMDDFMAFARTREGAPPFEEVAHSAMQSIGTSNFITVDLQPGAYVALCFIPDHAEGGSGMPHMALGMMQTFTVTGD